LAASEEQLRQIAEREVALKTGIEDLRVEINKKIKAL